MQCYIKAYMGFIKYTARDDAGYLLTVRCGELWVVPSSVNGLIKSDVPCYAQSLYSALKWQNLTCRQSTRASGLLLNAIFSLIIIVWSGTGWLHLKSYLVPLSLNEISIMSSLFFFFLISAPEISRSVICIQFAVICFSLQFVIQMGCNTGKSWSIYLWFRSSCYWSTNETWFKGLAIRAFSQLYQCTL